MTDSGPFVIAQAYRSTITALSKISIQLVSFSLIILYICFCSNPMRGHGAALGYPQPLTTIVSYSRRGVILPAADNLCLEFWGLLRPLARL